MKTNSISLDNPYAIIRGWVGPNAASSSGVGSGDGTTTIIGTTNYEFAGLTVTDLGSGNTLVSTQWKVPVRCATTANGAIATAYAAGQVVDGITLATNDQILLKDQTTTSQNGIYVVNATGAPTRAFDMNTSALVPGAVVDVLAGTTNAASIWMCTNQTAPVLETDAITFALINGSGVGTFETTTKGGGSVVKVHGNTGATETFDPADGNIHTATLDANCTFSLTNPASGPGCIIELRITQDGTGGRTITWPGSVTWAGGTPSPVTTASTLSIYVLETINGGSTWIGVLVGGGVSSSSFATPALLYGTAAAGTSGKVISSDATITPPTEAQVTFTDITTNNVTSTKHGFTPKSPADATQFLNGAATAAFAQVKDSDLSTSDITTNNVSTSKHGFTPKLPNDATKYLDGTGAYSVPAGSGGTGSTDHQHIGNVQYNGDGSTTAFELPAAPFDAYSVIASVAGVIQDVTLSGTMLTTMTFASAPGSGTGNVRVDIVAIAA